MYDAQSGVNIPEGNSFEMFHLISGKGYYDRTLYSICIARGKSGFPPPMVVRPSIGQKKEEL